ncbi:hypothetical protein J6590_016944 [Homalodisca vitripennis]|nr:hypothetical protein J6590_016944 [Homalodisca vitripennis]
MLIVGPISISSVGARLLPHCGRNRKPYIYDVKEGKEDYYRASHALPPWPQRTRQDCAGRVVSGPNPIVTDHPVLFAPCLYTLSCGS